MPPTRSRAPARPRTRDPSSHPRESTKVHKNARQKRKAEDSEGSILSSVFSFVSREFDSFLSTATGREPHVGEDESDGDYDEEEQSYEEEEQGGYSTPVKRKSTRSSNATRAQADLAAQRQSSTKQKQPQRRREASRSRRSRSKSNSESESSGTEVEKPMRKQTITASSLRDSIEEFEAPIHPESSDEPSPPPKTTQRSALRPKRSFTMPGSLYDRTSSLEPTPEPESRRLANRSVRFVSDDEDEDEGTDGNETFETPRAEPDEQKAGPSTFRAPIPALDLATKNGCSPLAEGVSDGDDVIEITPGPSRPRDTTKTRATATPASTTPRSLSRTPLTNKSSEPVPPSSSPIKTPTRRSKGKERAVGPLPIPPPVDHVRQISNESTASSTSNGSNLERSNSGSVSDASYLSNLKGKQRELDSAMQEQAERGRSNTSFDEEERARDKERIRHLEEELESLREELAKRPTTQLQFIAPPPPPPPPPPPLKFAMRASQNSDTSFADVRAALRPTEAANEKPINPAYDNTGKRKGQPTINLGADMMVAFLTEMKTHRLRKVGSATDGASGQASQPAVRAREVGTDVGNRTEVAIRPRHVPEMGNRTEFVPRRNAFATPAPPKASKLSNLVRQESTGPESEKVLSRKRKHVEDETASDSFTAKRRAIASPDDSNILSGLADIRGPATVKRARTSQQAQPQERQRLSALSLNSQPLQDSSLTSRNNSITSNNTASTSTGITTPSLSSDNGSRDDVHDRSPPTPELERATASKGKKPALDIERPPRIPASSSLGRRAVPIEFHAKSSEEDDDDVIEIDGFEELPQENRPKATVGEKSRDMTMTLDAFWGRGLTREKLVDSPRRPLPPARMASSTRGTPVKSPAHLQSERVSVSDREESDEEEMDQTQPADITVMPQSIADAESPIQIRKGPIRPPPGTFKAPPATSSLPPRFNRSFDIDKSRSFASAPNLSTNIGLDRAHEVEDEEENEAAEETFVIPKARARAKKAKVPKPVTTSANGPRTEKEPAAADETFLIPTTSRNPPAPSQKTRRKPRDSLDLELRRAEPSLLLDINLDDEMEHGRVNGGLGLGVLDSDADIGAGAEEVGGDELEYEESGDRTFLVPIQGSSHPHARSQSRSREHSRSRSRSGSIASTSVSFDTTTKSIKGNGKRKVTPHISSAAVSTASTGSTAATKPLQISKKKASATHSRSNSNSTSRSNSRTRSQEQGASVYEASGTGTRRPRGFLAHGGGGGAPVVMGEGYVEGLGGLGLSNVYDFDRDLDRSSICNEDVDDARDGDYIPRPVTVNNRRRGRM